MSFLSQPITLFPNLSQRFIEGIPVNVIISENTTDTLTITKQPVQTGASITDHAYKEPTGFAMQISYSANLETSLKELYQTFLDLQLSRVPFTIVTPKRIYKSMLMATLSQTTDKTSENCLSIHATFQEVILVAVTTTQVPRRRQKNPAATGKTEKAGKKSALFTVFGPSPPAALLP